MVKIVYLPLMETLWLIQKQLFLLEIVTVRYPRTQCSTGHFYSPTHICGSLIKVDGRSHLQNQWIFGEFLSSLDRMLIHCRLIQIVSQVKGNRGDVGDSQNPSKSVAKIHETEVSWGFFILTPIWYISGISRSVIYGKKIQNLLFDLWWRHTCSIFYDVT